MLRTSEVDVMKNLLGDVVVPLLIALLGVGIAIIWPSLQARQIARLGEGRLAVALNDGLLVLDLANDIEATELPAIQVIRTSR
jgi:hypothetical protein